MGAIAYLWREESAIQAAFANRANFHLPDCTQYFLDKVELIASPEYTPSQDDIIRCRVRTTGVTEETFEVDGVNIRITDVGGQRTERKKWIHCFDNVTAVLFFAGISEYDQVLFEDSSQNRLIESINLFDGICHSKWFEQIPIILFLNKSDLFELKIQQISIRDDEKGLFLDYEGGRNYEEGVRYIRDLFESRAAEGQEVYTHVTCATDTNNIDLTFQSCKDIILSRNLRSAGLLD